MFDLPAESVKIKGITNFFIFLFNRPICFNYDMKIHVNPSSTARRLRFAMDRCGMKAAELALRSGVNKSSISQYLNNSHTPSNFSAQKLANVLGVNMVWLMGFDVPKRRMNISATSIRIPVYGKVAAGYDYEAVENIMGYEEIPASWSGEYAALKVKGNSMEPRIMDGDILIVKIQDDAESGDVVIAVVNGNEATVKKLVKHQDGIVLQPFNPAYEPMYFSKESTESTPVRIWGKVIENRQKY